MQAVSEWFTPAFVLQIFVAIGSAGAMYGAIRQDLKHMGEKIAEEVRQREMLEAYAHSQSHELREAMHTMAMSVAVLSERDDRLKTDRTRSGDSK